jgi:hypothetical protein
MIVVAGDLGLETEVPASAYAIATSAAALGATVEIVGVVGSDGPGDRMLLELAARGIGHAAVLRSPATGLEPADLDLALHYLPEIGVIVVVDTRGDLVSTAASAAAWSGAGLIVVTSSDDVSALIPSSAFVLDPPASDPDSTFAGFVAALAGRLEKGVDPTAAWQATMADHAVDQVNGLTGS